MQIESVETSAGQRNLVRAVEDRRFHVLAVLEVVIDVLDRDCSVIDQDANRQGEAAQRHDVNGLAERRQTRDRGENR